MRVIAGKAKGRILKSVPGMNTRPTTDKVKESIFNMIVPYLQGGIVLDLFAGTGGLGIEALSRGMDHGIFIDHDRKSIEVIKSNIEAAGFTEAAEIYKNEAERAIKALEKRKIQFDLIFLDPPYKLEILERLIGKLIQSRLVSPNGMIVCEHDSKVQMSDEIESAQVIKRAEYGSTGITIYRNSKEV